MPIKAVLFDLGDTLIFQARTPDPAVLFPEMALRVQPLLDSGRHEVDLPPEADYAIHDLWELFTLGLLAGSAEAALPQDSLTPHEDANTDRY